MWRIPCFIVMKGNLWLRKIVVFLVFLKDTGSWRNSWRELMWSFGTELSLWKMLLHREQDVFHKEECWKKMPFSTGKFQRHSKLNCDIPLGYSLLVLFWFPHITFPDFLVLVFLWHFYMYLYFICVQACMCMSVLCDDLLTSLTFFTNWNILNYSCKIYDLHFSSQIWLKTHSRKLEIPHVLMNSISWEAVLPAGTLVGKHLSNIYISVLLFK